MKTIKYSLFLIFLMMSVIACDTGIDPITPLQPGTDATAPEVKILYPAEGTQIRVLEEVASIEIRFEVTDDIEVGEIKILIDGTEIAAFTDFKDYRRVIESFVYDNITNGEHILTVRATDLSGKTTEQSVVFMKVSPYTPMYEGELLYMPFDGDYVDLVNLQSATVVGNPGFAGESVIIGEGTNAYAGADGAYLTFPGEAFQSQTLSAVFWMKVNATPDRAGILVMGPPDDANPNAQNNRTSGFRFFRENAGGMQRFKLNVGFGEGDVWVDGVAAADVDPSKNEWVHMAFTIAEDKASVYINGQLVKETEFQGIDWTGCNLLSIMSGAPRFTGWDHLSDRSYMDELRIFNRALSVQDIRDIIAVETGEIITGYTPEYGEIFKMNFENEYMDLATKTQATVVGNPTFAPGIKGLAYSGAADAYLTFPGDRFHSDEFSASLWFNINADPDRAGILVMGPEDPDNPDAQNVRTSGFRFFRENAGGMQRFKLNVGSGDKETWFDGGAAADVDPSIGDWVHLAFAISQEKAIVYINGEIVKEGDLDGIDWTGCDLLSIMSGAPRFTGWNHHSDLSAMDELYIFDTFLTQDDVLEIMENTP